jgi:hypothetical protein
MVGRGAKVGKGVGTVVSSEPELLILLSKEGVGVFMDGVGLSGEVE